MLALKALDDPNVTEVYSVTHAGAALGWSWQNGAFTAMESTPWGEIKGDRHAVVPCDVDRDGDLDLVQAWGGAKGERQHFLSQRLSGLCWLGRT